LSLVWVPAAGLNVFLLLLFPDGRLPSRRWRWFFWLGLLLILVGTIWQAFAPGLVLGASGINNPLGVEGLPNAFKLVKTLIYTLILVSAASLFSKAAAGQWSRASAAKVVYLLFYGSD
jgi:hypothetical protein